MRRLLVTLLLFITFSLTAFAAQSSEYYYNEMMDDVDSEVEELLEAFGIENGSYDEILNLDIKNVVRQFLQLCRNEMIQPLQSIGTALILMMAVSMIQSLVTSENTVAQLVETIGTVLLSFTLFVPVSDCIASVLSVCMSTNEFTKILIPILAGIVTTAGKPALAVCFQGFCFVWAQGFASFFRSIFPPVCVAYTALSVCDSLSPFVSVNKIADLIKKGFTTLLSFASVLFSALLSVKSVIAGCADSVTVKSFKFIVGNAVPVVGGALSDALNSVITGILLLKSTIGILAILILVFINIPTLVELFMWLIALKILNSAVGVLGQGTDCRLITGFENLFTMMIAVVIFQMFLYIVAISLLIIISGLR